MPSPKNNRLCYTFFQKKMKKSLNIMEIKTNRRDNTRIVNIKTEMTEPIYMKKKRVYLVILFICFDIKR